MDEGQDENLFQPEEVDRRVYEVPAPDQILDELLLKTPYEESKIEELQNKACEKIMKMLVDYNLNFKYISRLGWAVNCTIIQKRGTGYTSASSNYWDQNQDAAVSTTWPKDVKKDAQFKMMRAFVTIHAVFF